MAIHRYHGSPGRRQNALRKLLPSAIKSAGQKGFYRTATALATHPEIRSPKRLTGWLKGQAHRRGQLSPKHAYTGRRKRKGRKVAHERARFRALTRLAG